MQFYCNAVHGQIHPNGIHGQIYFSVIYWIKTSLSWVVNAGGALQLMSDGGEDDEGDAGVVGLEGQDDSEQEDLSAASSSDIGSDDSDEFGEHTTAACWQHALVIWPEAYLQPYLLSSQRGCQNRLLFSIQKRHPYTKTPNSETSVWGQ